MKTPTSAIRLTALQRWVLAAACCSRGGLSLGRVGPRKVDAAHDLEALGLVECTSPGSESWVCKAAAQANEVLCLPVEESKEFLPYYAVVIGSESTQVTSGVGVTEASAWFDAACRILRYSTTEVSAWFYAADHGVSSADLEAVGYRVIPIDAQVHAQICAGWCVPCPSPVDAQ